MTSREAVIHIGTMKTGTTALRGALRRSEPLLGAFKTYYSNSIHFDYHRPWRLIAKSMRMPDAPTPRAAGLPEEWKTMVQQFKARIETEMRSLGSDVERVLISDERLNITLRAPNEIAEMKKLLAPYFDRFVIVVYLRPQASYRASRYSQSLRTRETSDPPTMEPPAEELPEYDYHALLERWGTVFGEDSLRPRIYERGLNRAFDSVEDFFTMLGLQDLLPQVAPPGPVYPSMNLVGQELLREIGRKLRATGQWRIVDSASWVDVCSAITQQLPGTGWQPKRSEAQAFMARFEDGNEAIRRRFFPERSSLFAMNWDSFPEQDVPPPSDREMLEAACAAFPLGFVRLNKRDASKMRSPVEQD